MSDTATAQVVIVGVEGAPLWLVSDVRIMKFNVA